MKTKKIYVNVTFLATLELTEEEAQEINEKKYNGKMSLDDANFIKVCAQEKVDEYLFQYDITDYNDLEFEVMDDE